MNTSAHAQNNHLAWLSWRGYLWLSWIGLLILALGGGLALLGGNLGGGFVLLGALLLCGGVLWIHPLPNLFKLFGMPGPYDEITHAFTIFFLWTALEHSWQGC